MAADGPRRIRPGVDRGSLYVGLAWRPVARKIANTVRSLGVPRFDMKYSAGPLAHEKMMKSIELYGTKVIPLVRIDIAGQLSCYCTAAKSCESLIAVGRLRPDAPHRNGCA